MAKKILVLAAAGIGDCLIATPLIRELRANFPDAEIHALVVYTGSRDLLEGNPHLTAIHQKNLIKDSKLKVAASIQGDAVRVSGTKKDDLQAAIQLVRQSVTDLPLQYINFRE